MSEDLYAKPDLTKKVRFQTTGEKEDTNRDICDDIASVRIYDNYWAEESTPQDKSQDNTPEDQTQIASVNVSSGKRNLIGAAAVFLGLMCLLFLVAVIVLVVFFILEKNRLWEDNHNLTSERDELQISFSEMTSLNHNLTQKTSQLENEKDHLNATNNNLTKIIDELQKHKETTCCPDKWITFGNSCYLMSTSKKTWTESRTVCENHEAQLVIISSNEEQEYISSFNRVIWIGLTDEESQGDWKWVDGTPISITYWRDNRSGGGSCAVISNIGDTLNNWNDLRCNVNKHFICEKILK